MGILVNFAKWLFVLCLPFLLFTAVVAAAFNSAWLYTRGFERNNVSATTGLSKEELAKTARGLIRYFNSDEDYINLTVTKDGQPFTLFNEREASHLKDVKDLVQLDYRVLLGTTIYCMAFAVFALTWRRREHLLALARGLVWGSGLSLAIMGALGLGTLVGFDQLFLRFHLFSFANDLWQLDPSRDYLIMLVPRDFWFENVLIGAIVGVIGALILGGIGTYLVVRTRTTHKDRPG